MSAFSIYHQRLRSKKYYSDDKITQLSSSGQSMPPKTSTISTTPSSRTLYEDSRIKLGERISASVQMIGSFCRQAIKSSCTNEIMGFSMKNFAITTDTALGQYETNLNRLDQHLNLMRQQLKHIEQMIDSYDSRSNRVN
ncbi:hypothetical protein SSS_08821 [Sarcoptes scabiei]|uniref:BLOC-1-related complex subunit 7 n=1 Tax=Sarcoptes scabiei TaxID=52283 RepID=A0A132AKJ1_SARSC|nr:hypothetical protein SSS_08821 [Sarcoptes scabiei]KPM11481.1 hypothetical protein QR98_0100520 [Sarcoptes scabiei]